MLARIAAVVRIGIVAAALIAPSADALVGAEGAAAAEGTDASAPSTRWTVVLAPVVEQWKKPKSPAEFRDIPRDGHVVTLGATAVEVTLAGVAQSVIIPVKTTRIGALTRIVSVKPVPAPAALKAPGAMLSCLLVLSADQKLSGDLTWTAKPPKHQDTMDWLRSVSGTPAK